MVYTRLDENVFADRRLGRHINHDPMSRRYAFRADQPLTAPLVPVEHVIHLPILDQGNIGSCVPNTGTENLAWDRIWQTLPTSVQSALNEQYAVQLYRDVTRADPYAGAWEPDDTGSDGLSLAKVLKDRGLISGYVHTFDVASALTALQTSPLAIGITWLSGCDWPDDNGFISYTGSYRGGHELLAVGYNPENQSIKIRNHWGEWWGDNGHCYMTLADFTRAIENDGDVIVLVPLDLPAPTPTPKYDEADLALKSVMDPWSNGIISKFTLAGKASAAYKNWKNAKGL